MQAASKEYFNVDAKKLTVPQAAFLATVVNNPSLYDPRAMTTITAVSSAATATSSTPWPRWVTSLRCRKRVRRATANSPTANQRYGGPETLMKMVERELSAAGFDSSQISGGGLKITTTFDEDAQEAAVEAAQKYTKQSARAVGRKASKLHAALASVDVNSGEVIALYGGLTSSRTPATGPPPPARPPPRSRPMPSPQG